MPDPNQNQEPTLAEVMSAIQELKGRMDEQDQFNQQVQEAFQGQNQPTEQEQLEALVRASDEELKSIGLTREEVNAAVAEANAGAGEESDAAPEGEEAGELATAGIESGTAGASGASAGAGTATAMSTLEKRVIQLEKRNAAKEFKAKKDAEEIELKAIEDKALKLAEQRDEAIKLAEGLKAENDALKMAVKTGTRPVKAGVDTGVRMFGANGDGELHPFQVRVKQLKESGKTEAQAIQFASKEAPELHAHWIQSQRQTVTV